MCFKCDASYSDDLETYVRQLGKKRVRSSKTQASVEVGEPGTGKTRLTAEKAELYRSSYYCTRGDWWDKLPQDCE